MGSGHRPPPIACRGGGAQPIEDLISRAPLVEVEQRISASPATVFSYLTDPSKFVQWMGVGAQLDPRPGGRFRIDADGAHIAMGEYREVDPPRRLVMTWGWQDDDSVPPGSTLVEITLTPEGSGTLLRLRHSGLPHEDSRASHLGGWTLYFARLHQVFTRA